MASSARPHTAPSVPTTIREVRRASAITLSISAASSSPSSDARTSSASRSLCWRTRACAASASHVETVTPCSLAAARTEAAKSESREMDNFSAPMRQVLAICYHGSNRLWTQLITVTGDNPLCGRDIDVHAEPVSVFTRCAGGGIRTHTGGFLGPVPLPLGYAGLRLRAHQVSVSAWQLGQRIRRLASRLSVWSPLTWSSARGRSWPRHRCRLHFTHRRSFKPALINRSRRRPVFV